MKSIQIITKILFFGIAAFAIARIIIHSSLLYSIHFLWFVLAYFLFIFMDKKGVNENYKLFVVLAIWLSLLGRVYFYANFFYYDKILHIIIPFFITLLAYDYFSKNLKPDKLAIFLFVMGILVSWEIFEYFVDTFGILDFKMLGVYDSMGNELMSPMKDTMIDLVIGAFSSLIALAFKNKK
jgi:hypothetical protein